MSRRLKTMLSVVLTWAMIATLLGGLQFPNRAKAAAEEPEETLIAIDETNFPDDLFRAYVSDKFDTGAGVAEDAKDGYLSEAEIASATYVGFYNSEQVTDLTGIQYFTELASLYVSYTSIDELDLSANTKLVYLAIPGLGLSELNLSGLTELETLLCSTNNITALDLSGCKKLGMLDCQNCDIDVLDISKCPKLIEVYLNGENTDDAQFIHRAYTEYDEENQMNMTVSSVWCDADTTVITGLEQGLPINEMYFPDDVFRAYVADHFDNGVTEPEEAGDGFLSDEELANVEAIYMPGAGVKDFTGIKYFTELKSLWSPYNPVTAIDLSKNTKLRYLAVDGWKLSELNLSGLTELLELHCSANEDLAKLDLSDCTKLKMLECFQTSVEELDISMCENLVKVFLNGENTDDAQFIHRAYTEYDEENQINITVSDVWCDADTVVITAPFTPIAINETNFPDPVFRALVSAEFDDGAGEETGNGFLSKDEIERATTIYISDENVKISDFTGIQIFTNLDYFFIQNMPVTELDLTNNRKLRVLYASNCNLSTLNISGLNKLEELFCSGNENLTALDLTKCVNLKSMVVFGCSIATLDVSNCTYLIALYNNANSIADDAQYINRANLDELGIATESFWCDRSTQLIGVDVVEPESEPKFDSRMLGITYDLAYEVLMSIPDGIDPEKAYMVFDISDGSSQTVSDPMYNSWYNTYSYVCHLNPLQLGDTITATFYWNDGADSISSESSAEDYCKDLLDSDSNWPVEKEMTKAILTYSHYLALSGWTDGRTHTAVALPEGKDITDEQLAYAAQATEAYKAVLGDYDAYGIQKILFALSLTDMTAVTVYALPKEGEDVIWNDLGTKKIGDDSYYVYRSCLVGAFDLGENQDINIYVGEIIEDSVYVMSVSPMAYVYSFLRQSDDLNKKLAMAAFYYYYSSVKTLVDYYNSLNAQEG